MNTPTNPLIDLSEQDATLLNQASEKLEEYAAEQRRRGNTCAAEGAECSAHAVQRLGAAMLAVQRKARPAQAVLDSNWKARMLDGRLFERDEMGFGEHPELPVLDEGRKPRAFFAALGVELRHTMAEDDLNLDEHETMNVAGNWNAWTPQPPAGDGWKLAAIFDTEDGQAAWWLRDALAVRAAQGGA
ncbi:hypothetical protein [Comamonas terrigena]|uniref:hypothetical protein n=1 Tax=Comamonas terrigena TaxID=32013 RepID=UPI002447BABB|nr:hypothetical protein [Comamonas terrigena]MDH1700316.1 hypothetical protein [Comamonas terrigena]